MNFTIEEFKELSLSPNAYLLLFSIIIQDLELQSLINTKTGNSELRIALFELQELGYIKINGDLSWIERQKLLDLRNKINPEPKFEEFWAGYHEYAKKFNPIFRATDKEAGRKHWKKLTKDEKSKAFENYKLFIDSTCSTMNSRYIKKAYTFIRDKNFLDEFVIEKEKRSLNKMI